MRRKLRVGDYYALTRRKVNNKIRYISLLAVLTSMCLYAAKQASAQQAEPAAPAIADTTASVRDTVAIDEVEIINTGYQRIPKERATGSFVFVDSTLLNRTFSTDVLSRLEGVASGLLFNKLSDRPDEVNITLRGQSTIQSENQPLIILDNFEYQGDLNNINPNDIENITVLRDASAASIWGAKAGNGVIVITTKKGSYNKPTQLVLTSNLSVREKQNLYNMPTLSSSDYIDLQQDLFSRGYFDRTLTNRNKPAVDPIVYLLDKQRKGELSDTDAAATIESFRIIDARDDLMRYLIRQSISQQYALALSGGGRNNQYYASAGWDNNLHGTVGDGYRRLSLTFNNTMALFRNRLEVKTGVLYTNSVHLNNGVYPVRGFTYPYARLADANGNALPIALYNQGFLDTVGNGHLLDWAYRPLDELKRNDNTSKLADLKVNVNIGYRPSDWLRLSGAYQYANGNSARRNYHPQDSYFARDLINQFSSIESNGEVIRPVPFGGMLDAYNSNYYAHRARAQADLSHSWEAHEWHALIGGELSGVSTLSNGVSYYGYDERYPRGIDIDAVNPFYSMVTGSRNLRISNGQSLSHLTDRFVSFYGNTSYGFRKKYWLSASVRRDGSNLFGVKANQQWSPFWSVGGKWQLDREDFMDIGWLPELALRFTYGTSGNIDKSVTAYLVARAAGSNMFAQPIMALSSPPNPGLSWETVSTANAGVDFSLFPSRRITGSFEYFFKRGRDLMSPAELPSVSGLLTYTGNTAGIRGGGFDLTLNSKNLSGAFRWQTSLLYSHTYNKVTEYRITPASNSSYVNGARVIGKPLGSIYAYRWAGLNPENGNPRGYLDGEISENYASIVNGLNFDDLTYVGPSGPTHFGSLRNSFDWQGISLSFNILFKAGYYIRNRLLNYGSLFNGAYQEGAAAFANRWRAPGDEMTTNTPSMVYPAQPVRDNFYTGSAVAFQRGDHIRLQDIRLAYRFGMRQLEALRLKDLHVYAVASNIGLLWMANEIGRDPDYGFLGRQKTYSIGLKLTY